MHGVKRQFLLDAMAVLGGIKRGGLRAHHDLAVLEGDDIRRPRDAHELGMHPRNRAIRDDGDADFIEPLQRETSVIGKLAAFQKSQARERTEPREIRTQRALPVLEDDIQRLGDVIIARKKGSARIITRAPTAEPARDGSDATRRRPTLRQARFLAKGTPRP